MSREKVEQRVREDVVKFSEKFTEDSKLFCAQVRMAWPGRAVGDGMYGYAYQSAASNHDLLNRRRRALIRIGRAAIN